MNKEEIHVNFLKRYKESSEKLLSINKKMKFQIKELSKTKSLIDECQNCLSMQNEMLNTLKLEQEKVFFVPKIFVESNNSASPNINDQTILTEIHKKSKICFEENFQSKERKKMIFSNGQMNETENVNKDEPVRENEISVIAESSVNCDGNRDNGRNGKDETSSNNADPSCQIRMYPSEAYVCDNLLQYALDKFQRNPECQRTDFPTQTQLPSKMKFMDAPKRATIIMVINKRLRHTIKEVFGEFSTRSSNEIRLTALNNSVGIQVNGVQNVIRLDKCESLKVTDFHKEVENITFFIPSIPSVLMLEVVHSERSLLTPLPDVPEFTYPETIYDLQERKSFLRKMLSLEECRRDIRFIAVDLVHTRSNLTTTAIDNSAVSLSIMDFSGKLLINLKITPRNPIKHMRETRLSQNDILGQLDEHDCAFITREVLFKRIIIGFNVYNSLNALRVPVEPVLGIRDMTTLAFLSEENIHQRGKRFTLPFLMKRFLPNFIEPVPINVPSEGVVHKIRALYMNFEDQWMDHLTPYSLLKSTISTEPYEKATGELVLEKEITNGSKHSDNCTLEPCQEIPFIVVNKICSPINRDDVETTSSIKEESEMTTNNNGSRMAGLNLEFGNKTVDDDLGEKNPDIDSRSLRVGE